MTALAKWLGRYGGETGVNGFCVAAAVRELPAKLIQCVETKLPYALAFRLNPIFVPVRKQFAGPGESMNLIRPAYSISSGDAPRDVADLVRIHLNVVRKR